LFAVLVPVFATVDVKCMIKSWCVMKNNLSLVLWGRVSLVFFKCHK